MRTTSPRCRCSMSVRGPLAGWAAACGHDARTAEFQAAVSANVSAVVLDTRPANEFWGPEGHISGGAWEALRGPC